MSQYASLKEFNIQMLKDATEKGGAEPDMFPQKCTLKICSLPIRLPVYRNDNVSSVVGVPLDPGHYSWLVYWRDPEDPRGRNGRRWTGQFYHGVSKRIYEKYKNKQPLTFRRINTTEGARWKCKHPGCKVEGIHNEFLAYVHEKEHFGIDILAEDAVDKKKATG